MLVTILSLPGALGGTKTAHILRSHFHKITQGTSLYITLFAWMQTKGLYKSIFKEVVLLSKEIRGKTLSEKLSKEDKERAATRHDFMICL